MQAEDVQNMFCKAECSKRKYPQLTAWEDEAFVSDIEHARKMESVTSEAAAAQPEGTLEDLTRHPRRYEFDSNGDDYEDAILPDV